MDIKIIKLDPARWSEYKALRLKALELEPSAFASSVEEETVWTDEKWIETLKEFQKGTSKIGYFAEDQGKLIGMMFARFGEHLKLKHVATIMGVFVDSDFRGQGVGKKLMAALLKDLEFRPEIVRIFLDVEYERLSAQNLYKSFGFKVIGRLEKALKVGDRFYDFLEMEKIIK
jgi:ribosomal protein S18 acetylase RimI-like enzyme